MGQFGIFDMDERYAKLVASGDPLNRLNKLIDWESFRTPLQEFFAKETKSKAGRKAYDHVLMLKMLVLQTLYNLSDHQIEYQVRDRISFMKFLGLEIEDRIPDEKTVWLFRENLTKGKVMKKLMGSFYHQLDKSGFQAESGQIVDATIIPAPIQRNKKKENEEIKEHHRAPEDWKENPSKLRQKRY